MPIDAPPDAADDLVVVVLGCESMRLDVERAFALAAALRIADDLHREPRTANREPRTANREPRTANRPARALRFAARPTAALSLFSYHAHCILILEIGEFAEFVVNQDVERSLLDTLSCWDGTLILTQDERHARLLGTVVESRLAPRLAVGGIGIGQSMRHLLWAAQLNRLHTACQLHPRSSRSMDDHSLRAGLERLPANWQPIVHRAIAWPMEWTPERIAMECCASRRTLERELRRVGLPSPKRLLRRR